LCIKNDFLVLIIELLRPGLPLDYTHVTRLNRYVTKIQAYVQEMGPEYTNRKVFGILIADYPHKDASIAMTLQDFRHNLEVYTWNSLFNMVQQGYRDYIEVLRMKAPEDPRMKGLVDLRK